MVSDSLTVVGVDVDVAESVAAVAEMQKARGQVYAAESQRMADAWIRRARVADAPTAGMESHSLFKSHLYRRASLYNVASIYQPN